MDGVGELLVVHNPDEEANNEDHFSEELTKVIDLLLKRGLRLILLSGQHLGVDTSDSSFHAGVGNDSNCVAGADDGGSEKHVLLVLQHLGALA